MRYVICSANVSSRETVNYRRLTLGDARRWLRENDFVSLIWHPDPEVAVAISAAFGVARVGEYPRIDLLAEGDQILEITLAVPANWPILKAKAEPVGDYCDFWLLAAEPDIEGKAE
jgi:hypothetical protein